MKVGELKIWEELSPGCGSQYQLTIQGMPRKGGDNGEIGQRLARICLAHLDATRQSWGFVTSPAGIHRLVASHESNVPGRAGGSRSPSPRRYPSVESHFGVKKQPPDALLKASLVERVGWFNAVPLSPSVRFSLPFPFVSRNSRSVWPCRGYRPRVGLSDAPRDGQEVASRRARGIRLTGLTAQANGRGTLH